MEEHFSFDQRLGILLPDLKADWEDYSLETQQAVLLQWETIRGSIPDRIAELEKFINQKQAELSNEGNFLRSCQLNSEISELASIINDLWIWYRADQTVSPKVHQ